MNRKKISFMTVKKKKKKKKVGMGETENGRKHERW